MEVEMRGKCPPLHLPNASLPALQFSQLRCPRHFAKPSQSTGKVPSALPTRLPPNCDSTLPPPCATRCGEAPSDRARAMMRLGNAALRFPCLPPPPQPAVRRSQRAAAARTAGGGRRGRGPRTSPASRGDRDRMTDLDSRLEHSSSLHSVDVGSADLPDASTHKAGPAGWRSRLDESLGRLSYMYFCWRRDTASDLQLFVLLNAAVFLFGAGIQATLLRDLDGSIPPPPEGAGLLHRLWNDLYGVLAVVLGQELPPGQAGWPSQVFAIAVALAGLASFALTLALTEQFVLEVLKRNVETGSRCYEKGHSVVLAWCESPRGVAQVTRILTQLCAANRETGGGVVVVLAQHRGKLEMESLFSDVVPEEVRYGTRFVFRQGSALDPRSLRMVAAADAKRIIVCGDYGRPSMEADAQVLRACVLLDEEMQRRYPDGQGGPIIVAQVKTEDTLPLMQYTCSSRVISVPTNLINARRYVRLLHSPIATVFSRNLTDFYSPAHACIDSVPELVGCTFGELHFRFPEAIVVGLQNMAAGYCQLNPEPGRKLQPGDDIVMLRAGCTHAAGQTQALPEPVPVSMGDWDPSRYIMRSLDEQPVGNSTAYDTPLATSGRPPRPASLGPSPAGMPGASGRGKSALLGSRRGLYVLPVQYSNPAEADTAHELLICGFMGHTFMFTLLAELDHSDQALPLGSRVTLFNSHTWSKEHFEARLQQYGIQRLAVTHVRGDPRSRSEMRRLVDVTRFKAAIVVCDSTWAFTCDGSGADGGLQQLTQSEMLSLDAAMLMTQLNVRMLLEEAGRPPISIICEKLTYLGATRFEDDAQPPSGIAVNSASYAAKALTKIAVEPRFLCAYLQLGAESDVFVQDSSAFAAEGEELSFMQLQARASSVRQVLMGFYRIPATASDPLELVVNPSGVEERSKPRVWNEGDWRCKMVTLAVRHQRAPALAAPPHAAAAALLSSSSSFSQSGSVSSTSSYSSTGSGSGSTASTSDSFTCSVCSQDAEQQHPAGGNDASR